MARFELSMNGKVRKFNNGYAMWKWANQQKKIETNFDEKKGPFLCDFFARRWEHRQKQTGENQGS